MLFFIIERRGYILPIYEVTNPVGFCSLSKNYAEISVLEGRTKIDLGPSNDTLQKNSYTNRKAQN